MLLRRIALPVLFVAAFASSGCIVEPEPVDGDGKTCSDFAPEGATWLRLDLNPPINGTYAAEGEGGPGLNITVEVRNGTHLAWAANIGSVEAVLVRGEGSHLYRYNQSTAGVDLRAPDGEIIHASFCFARDVPPCPDAVVRALTGRNLLEWGAAPGATSYRVYRGVGDAAPTVFNETTSLYLFDHDVSPDVAYTYTVTGVNPGGESSSCHPLETSGIPFFPSLWAVAGSVAIGAVILRRRR